MSLGINFLLGSRVLTAKKKWMKKADSLSTEEIHEIMDNSVPLTTKKAAKLEIRLLSGTYTLPFLAKLKFDRRDFTH